jgi:DNA repair ATPase RecN
MKKECAQAVVVSSETKDGLEKTNKQVQVNKMMNQKIIDEFESLKDIEFKNLKSQGENCTDQVQELYQKLHQQNHKFVQQEKRFQEVDERLNSVQEYVIFKQPVITHLQISDFMQEVLGVTEQYKLF